MEIKQSELLYSPEITHLLGVLDLLNSTTNKLNSACGVMPRIKLTALLLQSKLFTREPSCDPGRQLQITEAECFALFFPVYNQAHKIFPETTLSTNFSVCHNHFGQRKKKWIPEVRQLGLHLELSSLEMILGVYAL